MVTHKGEWPGFIRQQGQVHRRTMHRQNLRKGQPIIRGGTELLQITGNQESMLQLPKKGGEMSCYLNGDSYDDFDPEKESMYKDHVKYHDSDDKDCSWCKAELEQEENEKRTD